MTFDLASDSQEQECMFIDVEEGQVRIKDAKATAKVIGKIRIFANSDKIPYGYLTKKIAEANPSDTANLFFHGFESNHGAYLNIAERSLSFVYLFESQYDPNMGEITELINDINIVGT